MSSIRKSVSALFGAAVVSLAMSGSASANIFGNGGIIGLDHATGLNIGGNGGIIGLNRAPGLNIGGNGGFIGMAPYTPWNIGGNGGIISLEHPAGLNIGGNGGIIGIQDAKGNPVPVQNIGGNGGFIAVVPPEAPKAVLCKLKDQVLIAGALESCEKAGGKAIAPEEATKK